MNAWKQLRAILPLPGMVTVAVPATILYLTGLAWPPSPWNIVLPVIGLLFVFAGLILVAWTIGLFVTLGKGTLAPWNPPQKLLVRRVYRFDRSIMSLMRVRRCSPLCLMIWPDSIVSTVAEFSRRISANPKIAVNGERLS